MGLVIRIGISSANGHDGTIAINLSSSNCQYFSRLKKVFVDGCYKGHFDTVVQPLFEVDVEISSRPTSAKGFVPLKTRWIVERTFAWFNFFRRISKDYEKTIESSAA